jgi:hypothetical protein
VRDERALVDGGATRVLDRGKRPLDLDLDGVLRTLRVAVTLEDLSAVAPAAWRLQESGLLPTDEGAPWIVGIHELELICQLVQRPAELVHYIVRRARANRQRIWAMDEMDFFIQYLRRGLFWTEEEVSGAYLELGSHTDSLDAWWYGEQVVRKKAPRPKQKMNKNTRTLLDYIEATGMAGRIEAQLMVYEMSTATRERVAAGLRQLLRRTATDGQPHDMTLEFGDDFGVTLHSVPAYMAAEASDRLADHGLRRVELSGPRRWLGLSTIAGFPRLSRMALIVKPEQLSAGYDDGANAAPLG